MRLLGLSIALLGSSWIWLWNPYFSINGGVPLGLIMLAIGGVGLGISFARCGGNILRASVLVLCLLTVQLLLMLIIDYLEIVLTPTVPVYSVLAAYLLRLAGHEVHFQSGDLLIAGVDGALTITPYWSLVGMRYLTLAVVTIFLSFPHLKLLHVTRTIAVSVSIGVVVFGVLFTLHVAQYIAIPDVLTSRNPAEVMTFMEGWDYVVAVFLWVSLTLPLMRTGSSPNRVGDFAWF